MTIIEDLKENILLNLPTKTGQMAYATDTGELVIWNEITDSVSITKIDNEIPDDASIGQILRKIGELSNSFEWDDFSLNKLNEVEDAMSPNDGEVLTYDTASSLWNSKTIEMTDLTDIGTMSPNGDEVLTYDDANSEWTSKVIPSVEMTDLTDVGIMSPNDGEVLTYDTANGWQSEALPIEIIYNHPTFDGDDIDIDTTLLSSASVISELDFNITTDLEGHVTDANATIATREITPIDIGAATETHSHPTSDITQPAGVMFDFAGVNAPAGSLSCEGQEVSKTTYAVLYSAIGDVWSNTGGASNPNSSNFRLPPSEIGGLGLYNRGVGTSTNVGDYQANDNKSHDHTSASHSHTMGTHDHTSASHSHTMNQHDHTSAAHSHTMGTHLHSVTHDHGAFSVTTNTDGGHEHTTSSRSALENAVNDAGGAYYATEDGSRHNENIVEWGNSYHNHALTVNVPSFTGNTVAVDPGDTNSTTPNSTGSTDPGDTNATTPNKVGLTDPGDTNSTTPNNTGSEGGSENIPQSITVLKCIWTGI